MPIVDTHAHVFLSNLAMVDGARYRPDYDARLEEWMAAWSGAGVTHGVLVQPSFLGTDNSYMLAQMRLHSQRLRGVIVVDAGVPEALLAQAHAAGVRGIRLNLIGVQSFSPYAQPAWQGLFFRLHEMGWHLEVQCLGEHWPRLLASLGSLPLALVVDHFGLPDPGAAEVCPGARAIVAAADRRAVYVKLSASYRLRGADAARYARYYLAHLGAERLLWGSDWPWTNHEAGRNYPACLETLRQHLPEASPSQVDAMLHEAPFRLYGFEG
ncbi:Predicted metal-dependent hydrolase, TIM-barrel fold [Noviherbaspirillum humi]|uniref:Predicted metal-dependent hydrolase, TIM-barrel fold n=1 Tax=Noviherbaspirillum humi TaxID=1688639 RepID=A0A239KLQ2_9BURK|nr:amidohydrolase family protein [Noviherbaspirillum humi]SNT18920.1 Predicted metal-dependent hydrolase, TIM-barrel fold [Noviherbaspirillum humi]